MKLEVIAISGVQYSQYRGFFSYFGGAQAHSKRRFINTEHDRFITQSPLR